MLSAPPGLRRLLVPSDTLHLAFQTAALRSVDFAAYLLSPAPQLDAVFVRSLLVKNHRPKPNSVFVLTHHHPLSKVGNRTLSSTYLRLLLPFGDFENKRGLIHPLTASGLVFVGCALLHPIFRLLVQALHPHLLPIKTIIIP